MVAALDEATKPIRVPIADTRFGQGDVRDDKRDIPTSLAGLDHLERLRKRLVAAAGEEEGRVVAGFEARGGQLNGSLGLGRPLPQYGVG